MSSSAQATHFETASLCAAGAGLLGYNALALLSRGSNLAAMMSLDRV